MAAPSGSPKSQMGSKPLLHLDDDQKCDADRNDHHTFTEGHRPATENPLQERQVGESELRHEVSIGRPRAVAQA